MLRTHLLSTALALLITATFSAGCESSGVDVQERTVRVGCGSCQFGLKEHSGCYWAADVGERVLPLGGPGLPQDHDDHGPEGMCNVTREATVTGTLYQDRFAVTRMELGPVDDSAGPAHAHPHAH